MPTMETLPLKSLKIVGQNEIHLLTLILSRFISRTIFRNFVKSPCLNPVGWPLLSIRSFFADQLIYCRLPRSARYIDHLEWQSKSNGFKRVIDSLQYAERYRAYPPSYCQVYWFFKFKIWISKARSHWAGPGWFQGSIRFYGEDFNYFRLACGFRISTGKR